MRSPVWWLFSLLVAFILFVSPSARAQTQTPQMSAEEIQARLDQAKARLNLTDDQVAAIKPLIQQEAEKLRALRARYGDSMSRRDKVQLLREAKTIQSSFNDGMEQILTPDQMPVWKEMQAEARAKLKEEYQRRKGSG